MGSLRSHEGYYMMDHRVSPGVPDELVVKQGLVQYEYTRGFGL
jgi:hypothetical protein